MNLEIRLATCTDLPILNQLYAEMDDTSPLPSEQIERIFAEITQIPNYQIFLAYWQEQPVGTFSLLFLPTMMHPGIHKSALLDSVVVSAAYRCQGIGRAMVREALKLSAAAGCYKVTLSSNLKRDRAHAFYQSLGFQQHGWSFSLEISHKKWLPSQ